MKFLTPSTSTATSVKSSPIQRHRSARLSLIRRHTSSRLSPIRHHTSSRSSPTVTSEYVLYEGDTVSRNFDAVDHDIFWSSDYPGIDLFERFIDPAIYSEPD